MKKHTHIHIVCSPDQWQSPQELWSALDEVAESIATARKESARRREQPLSLSPSNMRGVAMPGPDLSGLYRTTSDTTHASPNSPLPSPHHMRRIRRQDLPPLVSSSSAELVNKGWQMLPPLTPVVSARRRESVFEAMELVKGVQVFVGGAGRRLIGEVVIRPETTLQELADMVVAELGCRTGFTLHKNEIPLSSAQMHHKALQFFREKDDWALVTYS